MNIQQENLQIGVGLRSNHFEHLNQHKPLNIDWFEAITENFLDTNTQAINQLKDINEHYPVALHGVSLSIASAEKFDIDYLAKVKTLIKDINPFLFSDHLCWTQNSGHHFHNLFPFSYTRENLDYIISRIHYLQDYFGRALILENLSAYVAYEKNEFTEWEFFAELYDQAECKILLDINNVYVNSQNHGFDPKDFIDAIIEEGFAL